ncbi:MAG TPA: hypothetical protein VGS22_14145 [Thermoanaerobaculia bacterium]|jgi:hypothetical protein|nr:hypothetical protein [Thermoanaerobaculia bacterium]
MSTDTNEDSETAADRSESVRRKAFLAGDFYARLAEAAVAGFRAFRDELAAEEVSSRGLPHSFVLGLVSGHTTFVERAAEATRELLDPEPPDEKESEERDV